MGKKRILIAAGKFKAECLQLMDLVAKNGSELVITKRGKPVAKLVPVDERPVDLFGYLSGELNIIGDVTEPVGERWDADG